MIVSIGKDMKLFRVISLSYPVFPSVSSPLGNAIPFDHFRRPTLDNLLPTFSNLLQKLDRILSLRPFSLPIPSTVNIMIHPDQKRLIANSITDQRLQNRHQQFSPILPRFINTTVCKKTATTFHRKLKLLQRNNIRYHPPGDTRFKGY